MTVERVREIDILLDDTEAEYEPEYLKSVCRECIEEIKELGHTLAEIFEMADPYDAAQMKMAQVAFKAMVKED